MPAAVVAFLLYRALLSFVDTVAATYIKEAGGRATQSLIMHGGMGQAPCCARTCLSQ